MDTKGPNMGLPPGVVSGSSTNAVHHDNSQASEGGMPEFKRADIAKVATPSAATHVSMTNTVVTPSATTTPASDSSALNTPSPYMPNMSTAVVPVLVAPLSMDSGFTFANTSAGLEFGGFELMKKKRGRPRKYGPESSLALTVSPLSAMAPLPLSPSHKRGRGRPPGSGKNQQLAALGELMLGSVGAGFTPHAITVEAGEDIASRIMSFSQQGPRGICILSANGAVSSVAIRQPSLSGGIVTYEGRFEILSLSGSFLLTYLGGARTRTGGLSVSLARPDGRVIGGSIAGVLIAASPVQVIVGSFLCNVKKLQPKAAKIDDGSTDPPKTSTSNNNNTTCPEAPPLNKKSDDDDEDDAVDDDDVKPVTARAESSMPNKSTEGAPAASSTTDPAPCQGTAQSAVLGWSASQITTEGKHFTNNDISLQG